MKPLMIAIAAVMGLNVVAGLGFVGWLHQSNRLNEDRLGEAVELFKPTIAEEQLAEQQAEEAIADAEAQAQRIARLEAVSQGPRSVSDRLREHAATDAALQEMLTRWDQEKKAIHRRLEQDRALLQAERERLEAQQAKFEQEVSARAQKFQDEDFRRAVKTIEKLDGVQAKEMLKNLMAQGRTNEVVDYLVAMNQRASTGIIGEFTTPEEIAQAAFLVEQIRTRSQGLADLSESNDSEEGS